MPIKKVFIEDIGECTLNISRRSSRIRITIRPFDGIRVNIPYGLSYEHGIRFVEDKKKWILKTRERFAAIEKEKTIFLPGKPFQTRFHTLDMVPRNQTGLRANIFQKKITVTFPKTVDPEDNQVQEFVKQSVIEALRLEAKMALPPRLATLAKEHGYQYNKVFIKNLKSRWGSCSGRDNINLNLHLMRLPDELVDYVLLHELVHTVHKDHSAAYWKELNKVTGNKAKRLQAQLREYNVHF